VRKEGSIQGAIPEITPGLQKPSGVATSSPDPNRGRDDGGEDDEENPVSGIEGDDDEDVVVFLIVGVEAFVETIGTEVSSEHDDPLSSDDRKEEML